MTPRDQLVAVLSGEALDPPPVWLLFPHDPIGCYADVRRSASYRPVLEAADGRAVTLNRRKFSVPLFAPEVTERSETGTEGGWSVRRQVLSWKDVTLVAEERRRGDVVRITKMLDTEDDLEAFARLPVQADRAQIHAALDAQLPAYLVERDAFPADWGAMMLDLGEPVGPLYHLSNLEEYAIWSLTHDDVVRGILDRFMERWRIVYDWCLERDLADVYFLVGSELASPPLVSRDTFRRWIVPYASELIERIHGAGKFAIQHYHGQIREILPDFVTMNPDGLHTVEAPPVGNCTHEQAYGIVGDRIALIGNVQYDCFRSATPKTMARAVRELREKTRGRRFILSPTAGPFEPELSGRMRDNYLAFLRAAAA